MWDADGAGPAPARLLVGGTFQYAGDITVSHIATWDPATGAWGPLGSGLSNNVRAFATLADGSLAVGGAFTFAGGAPANYVARWDGATWSPFGFGMFGGAVLDLLTLANGDLVAVGAFGFADGIAARGIARWNGSAWSALGSSLGGTSPFGASVVELPNGDLIVGGSFASAGGVPAANLARWDGSAWSAIGTGADNVVDKLLPMPNGDLLVLGRFTTIDGVPANRIARWDGTTFTPLGSGLDANAVDAQVLPNGDIVVAGSFQNAGGVAALRLARWDGTSWHALGSGVVGTPGSSAAAVALAQLPSGDLVVGGTFQIAGGTAVANLARWNGTDWSQLSPGTYLDGILNAATATANGNLVVGGSFRTIGTIAANSIARWNGTAWSPLGAGLSGSFGSVAALTSLPNGDLVVGGTFTTAGTASANHIARWDGVSWSGLGTGMSGGAFVPGVAALAVLPNGDLVAGGSFATAGTASANSIARWDGVSWSGLGTGMSGGPSLPAVGALVVLPNGDLIAGGVFQFAGGVSVGNIARWNGTTWSPLGTGTNGPVTTLLVHPDGSLLVGGSFTTAGGIPCNCIARWNGTAWSPLGTGFSGSPPNLTNAVYELALLPNGDVVAGGLFLLAGGARANRIARWNGSTWTSFGAGCSDVVTMLTVYGDELLVSGAFKAVDGLPAWHLAHLGTTCPPTAVPTGSGCNGATLTAATLPWVDAPFRAIGTGLPQLALVLAVTSTTPVAPPFPLNAVFPQALPGCDLLVAPDIQQVLFTTTGVATSELFLSNTPPLIGVTFHHQMVPIEIDAQLNFLAITATNALQLTAGAL
ncbi:MAG: hypothetical protein JNL08_20855 [Planctomycetes bacterium]|nr:hypothetical protein [Planctomycetota bacterium]